MRNQNWIVWALVAFAAYWLFFRKENGNGNGNEDNGADGKPTDGYNKPATDSKFPASGSNSEGGTMNIPVQKRVSFL